MTVTVLLFADLRRRAGSDRLELELPDVADVRAAAGRMEERIGRGSLSGVMCAVNERYADPATPLRQGDVVAFLPPVSGG